MLYCLKSKLNPYCRKLIMCVTGASASRSWKQATLQTKSLLATVCDKLKHVPTYHISLVSPLFTITLTAPSSAVLVHMHKVLSWESSTTLLIMLWLSNHRIFRYLVCEDHTSSEVLCADDGLAYDDISQTCVYRSSTCGGYMRLLLPDNDLSYRELLGLFLIAN